MKALIDIMKVAGVTIPGMTCEDYATFLTYLTEDCPPVTSTSLYVNWECTPDKNHLCPEISRRFDEVQNVLVEKISEEKTCKMSYFGKIEITTKAGETKEVLKPMYEDVNIKFILNFISKLLPKAIHHRNLLKNYRSNIEKTLENLPNCPIIDVDFSENLTGPVPEEPQDYHFTQHQLTVHSGMIKYHGEKQNHPYFSSDLKHDQSFVRAAIEEMVSEIDLTTPNMCVIIQSDNCSNQYKSSANFFDLQELSDRYKVPIVRIYGVAGHGKNEIDAVGRGAWVTPLAPPII